MVSNTSFSDKKNTLFDQIWALHMDPLLTHECAHPYDEDQSRDLSGRNSLGVDGVRELLDKPFSSVVDYWNDDHYDYVAQERERATEEIIKTALDSKAIQALLSEFCEGLADDEIDMDADDLIDVLQEEAQEIFLTRAIEEGKDTVFDVSFSLTGSIEANYDESFFLPIREMQSDDEAIPLLPLFNQLSYQTNNDWFQFLLTLQVPPHLFINECIDHALARFSELEALKINPTYTFSESEESDLTLISEWLLELDIDPASAFTHLPEDTKDWPDPLKRSMITAASAGLSYPEISQACCSVTALYESLVDQYSDGYYSLSFEDGIDSDDLTVHSTLLDSTPSDSLMLPFNANTILNNILQAHPDEVYLNGEPLKISNPFYVSAGSLSLSNHSADTHLTATAAPLREEAAAYESLSRLPQYAYTEKTKDADFKTYLGHIKQQFQDKIHKLSPQKLECLTQTIENHPFEALSPLEKERISVYQALCLTEIHQIQKLRQKYPYKEPSAPHQTQETLLSAGFNSPAGFVPTYWREDYLHKINVLIEKGQVNQQDSFGNTLLHHAFSLKDISLSLYLISQGADLKAPNLAQEYPASFLLKGNDLKAVLPFFKKLAEHGQSIHQWEIKKDYNLLHMVRDFDLALELVNQGVNPSQMGPNGKRADDRITKPELKAQLEKAYLSFQVPFISQETVLPRKIRTL